MIAGSETILLRLFSNPDIQAKYQGGKADEHLDFIRDDVVPFYRRQLSN